MPPKALTLINFIPLCYSFKPYSLEEPICAPSNKSLRSAEDWHKTTTALFNIFEKLLKKAFLLFLTETGRLDPKKLAVIQ